MIATTLPPRRLGIAALALTALAIVAAVAAYSVLSTGFSSSSAVEIVSSATIIGSGDAKMAEAGIYVLDYHPSDLTTILQMRA